MAGCVKLDRKPFAESLKYRAILMTAFAGGLRVEEVTALVKDTLSI